MKLEIYKHTDIGAGPSLIIHPETSRETFDLGGLFQAALNYGADARRTTPTEEMGFPAVRLPLVELHRPKQSET